LSRFSPLQPRSGAARESWPADPDRRSPADARGRFRRRRRDYVRGCASLRAAFCRSVSPLPAPAGREPGLSLLIGLPFVVSSH
jgi:hypothetical protein